MAIDILAKGLRSIGFVLPSDISERFQRIDAAWWVPRVDELKKVFRSAGAIVPK
jgi:hypothetical protein